ncbi:MAG: hypothetical protein GC190_19265 [Alphaproteobacteria bacterium]|nr:hypothetical protein [Alphaproteobacteria bacterium]
MNNTMPRLRILSLGAGVQSTTMALMAAHGELTPMPDCAIFADTQWEPKAVYEHLKWLMSPNVLPFPVHIATRGSLKQSILERRNSTGGRFAVVPWHIVNPDGSYGFGRRQCTSEFKLTPLMWKMRELLGVDRRARIAANSVEVWGGISTDEASRMKPARQQWQQTRWPLIETRKSRRDCESWLQRHSYPVPPKSSCLGCPFHSDAIWRDLRDNSPDEWAETVEVDRAMREGDARGFNGVEFMHSQRVPLDQIDLSTAADRGQADLFDNECEGMCGL